MWRARGVLVFYGALIALMLTIYALAVVQSLRNSATTPEEQARAIAQFNRLELGMPVMDVLRSKPFGVRLNLMNSGIAPEDSGDLALLSDSGFGMWQVYVLFVDDHVAAYGIRTMDSADDHPANAPQDIVIAEVAEEWRRRVGPRQLTTE